MKVIREHQAQDIQPLVITPSPVKGEGLQAFILRTAERNGYESPTKLLHYSGMDDNEARSARPPLEKLAPLFGKSVDEFKAYGLDSISQSKGRHLQIMGHTIPSMFTKSKHAGLCIECVKEYGYIDGFHELKYALVCPKHQIKTLDTCHVCNKALSWHRTGLTNCSCGADLTQANSEKISNPAVIALLGVLYAKLMRLPLNEMQLYECGFPKEAIDKLTIQTLLSVIYRFGLFSNNPKDADIDMIAITKTAEVFSNWPHKFHDYLEEVHAPGANLKVSGLRGQFNSFYESFFKNIQQDQELQFMRGAFISFGQERLNQVVHSSFVPTNLATVVGINALSKKINKHPSTIRKLVSKGLIQVKATNNCHSRLVFDLTEQQQFAFAEGKSLSIKSASKILDIPVEILRAYRARGYYQARYLAAPIVLFHERDIEQLHIDLMQGCQLCKVFVDKKNITLAQVMRMKTTAEIKAAFIAEVIKQTVVPIGKLTDKPSGLVFDKALVNYYLHQLQEGLQGGMSFEEAKTTIQVGREVLFNLIKTDILQCRYRDNTMQIAQDSVSDFDVQYISCQEVARLKMMTQKSVINLCNLLGVKVYQQVQTDLFKESSFWIDRQQLALLGHSGQSMPCYAKVA